MRILDLHPLYFICPLSVICGNRLQVSESSFQRGFGPKAAPEARSRAGHPWLWLAGVAAPQVIHCPTSAWSVGDESPRWSLFVSPGFGGSHRVSSSSRDLQNAVGDNPGSCWNCHEVLSRRRDGLTQKLLCRTGVEHFRFAISGISGAQLRALNAPRAALCPWARSAPCPHHSHTHPRSLLGMVPVQS